MKTILYLLSFTLFAPNIWANSIAEVHSARVTYLANCGFMVQVGQTTLMFDGCFQNGMDRYQQPDANTVELMKNGAAPFDKVDYVFISNFHADHFDPYVLTQFLLHNETAKLFCPQQVINRLRIFNNDFSVVSKRIIEVTPVSNYYDRLLVDGIEIVACNLKSEKRMNDYVENMAYLVNVNGVKLFHSGDSSVETLDDLRGINLREQNVDIAFLNVIYGVGRYAKQTNKLVNARYTVLMHLEKYITDQTLNSFCERSKLTSKPYVFNTRNEYQDFFLSDFFFPVTDEESLTLSQY